MKKSHFWQAAWWRQKERGRWALTLSLAMLLVAGGVVLDRTQAAQEAAEAAARLAAEQQALEAERIAAELLERQAREEQAMEAREQQEAPAEAGGPQEQSQESEAPQAEPSAYTEDGQLQNSLQAEALRVSAGSLSFVMPVHGQILRGQGYDYDPSTEDYRFHRGIDLSAAAGDPVFSAAAGKVSAAAEDAYWGGIVVVDHGGGWSSAYRGLEPAVEVGAQVEAGELLGRVLSNIPAEAAQESHIHVELSLEGDTVDPSAWL